MQCCNLNVLHSIIFCSAIAFQKALTIFSRMYCIILNILPTSAKSNTTSSVDQENDLKRVRLRQQLEVYYNSKLILLAWSHQLYLILVLILRVLSIPHPLSNYRINIFINTLTAVSFCFKAERHNKLEERIHGKIWSEFSK